MFKFGLPSLWPSTEVPNARHWKQPKKAPSGSRSNSRKTAGKTVKTPKKKAVLTFFGVFRLFFRMFFGCFTVTHSAPFSAVFRLFSMSGIWHLCRWPQRLQSLRLKMLRARLIKDGELGVELMSLETGRIQVWRVRFQAQSSVNCLGWGSSRELTELSSQSWASVAQNLVSLFQHSTLKTEFPTVSYGWSLGMGLPEWGEGGWMLFCPPSRGQEIRAID